MPEPRRESKLNSLRFRGVRIRAGAKSIPYPHPHTLCKCRVVESRREEEDTSERVETLRYISSAPLGRKWRTIKKERNVSQSQCCCVLSARPLIRGHCCTSAPMPACRLLIFCFKMRSFPTHSLAAFHSLRLSLYG